MLYHEYNPHELEPQILAFWQKNQIVEKLRKRNQKGRKFSFLQGPPYTSGKIHLGTAWNTALKDLALRYKRSQGFNVWDRNGYDVHGLPTAHQVMSRHHLKNKDEIAKFGVGKFVKECEKFSLEMGRQMTEDFQRLGCTLDYSDSYMALKNDYMEGEWWLAKQAYGKNRLYLGEKVMTWCQHCETVVAKHECEYKNIAEKSIFLKFKVRGKKDEYLIIWTTTPWTIPFNLAVMVNPEMDYQKVDVGKEKWILAKALAGMVVQAVADKKMKVLEDFKGRKLEGLAYEHPLEKALPPLAELRKKFPRVHTVILSEKYVDTSAGSGLVHAAPGCGPEDQEACEPYHLPPFNSLTEEGFFPPEMGRFAGLRAKVDDHRFIEALEQEGSLIAVTDVEHEYPHCWRCHRPVIFRTTWQWFFKIEDLIDVIIKENQKVRWVPQTNAFDAWTAHLKNNSITRQREWGTPVPIWKCSQCGKIEVIGSLAELKEKAGKIPEDIHKPWIDEVKWKCDGKGDEKGRGNGEGKDSRKCPGMMTRIPDIFDVWIDAGTAAWNCFYYPQREEYLKDYFPADLILEATEQVRLWFSMLSICSQLALGRNSYRNVYMHGMLRDVEGQKMSKSLGNIISPDELVGKYGADVLRYYMCQNNAGQDINFSWEECKVKSRQLHILWNIHKLLINLAKENRLNPFELKISIRDTGDTEERYIISKLHSAIKTATELFDAYRLDETIAPIEGLFLELSRVYIQMVRDKSSVGSEAEKKACVYAIGQTLFECLKMFNIIAPFVCEAIYLNLKEEFKLKEESISHCPFPRFDEQKIDLKLEKEMGIVQAILQSVSHARENAGLGLRWPVPEIVVVSQEKEVREAAKNLEPILKAQANAKKVRVIDSFAVKGTAVFEPSEFRQGKVYLNKARTEELEQEGFSREVMRQVQSLRKKAGLEKTDRIELHLKICSGLDLRRFEKEIKEKVGAKAIEISGAEPTKKFAGHHQFKVKGEEFEVWFEKV